MYAQSPSFLICPTCQLAGMCCVPITFLFYNHQPPDY
jgi:hypothetical protein